MFSEAEADCIYHLDGDCAIGRILLGGTRWRLAYREVESALSDISSGVGLGNEE